MKAYKDHSKELDDCYKDHTESPSICFSVVLPLDGIDNIDILQYYPSGATLIDVKHDNDCNSLIANYVLCL